MQYRRKHNGWWSFNTTTLHFILSDSDRQYARNTLEPAHQIQMRARTKREQKNEQPSQMGSLERINEITHRQIQDHKQTNTNKRSHTQKQTNKQIKDHTHRESERERDRERELFTSVNVHTGSLGNTHIMDQRSS